MGTLIELMENDIEEFLKNIEQIDSKCKRAL